MPDPWRRCRSSRTATPRSGSCSGTDATTRSTIRLYRERLRRAGPARASFAGKGCAQTPAGEGATQKKGGLRVGGAEPVFRKRWEEVMGELPQVHVSSIAGGSYRILTAADGTRLILDRPGAREAPGPLTGPRPGWRQEAKKGPEHVAPNRSSGDLPTTISSAGQSIPRANRRARHRFMPLRVLRLPPGTGPATDRPPAPNRSRSSAGRAPSCP